MMLILLAFLMALSPLFAPEVTPAAAAPRIAPHTWELASFTLGDDAPVEVGEPAQYTAQFLPDDTATFRLDCNRGNADVIASDGQFALTALVSTDALCPPGSYDEAFTALLLSAASYRFDDTGHLILRGPQGALLLRPALGGVLWQWQGIADGDGSLYVAAPTPERYTLEFLGDGELVIRADCNRGRGRIRMDGIAMAIRPGGMTRVACLSSSMSDLYLAGLRNVEHWYLFDGVLSLSLPDGAGMMIFSPVVTSRAIPPGAE